MKSEEEEDKVDWSMEVLRALMWLGFSALGSLFCGVSYCLFWKRCTHRQRVRLANSARERHAARGMEAGLTPPTTAAGVDVNMPPPPAESDGVSITSSDTSQPFRDAPSDPQPVEESTSPKGTSVSTGESSTNTPTTPQAAGSAQASASASTSTAGAARGAAASLFRRAAQVVGYPTGIPLDPSATGSFIRHDQPVPQAADYVRPGKKLVVKKKAPPPTAPKPRGRPRSKSRGRPTSPPPARLASRTPPPRRSLRKRVAKKT